MDNLGENRRDESRNFRRRNDHSNTRNRKTYSGGPSNTRNGFSNTRSGSLNDRKGNGRRYQGKGDLREEGFTGRFHSAPRVQGRSDSRPADHQHIHPSRCDHIGFKYLESLSELPVEDTINKLNSSQGFFGLLEKQLQPDFVVLIVKIIGKICDCELSTIRNQFLKRSLSNSFLNSIQLFITGLAFQTAEQKRRSSYFWKDSDSFWNNLVKSYKTVLKVMPQFYSEALSTNLKCILLNIPQIESSHNVHISDGIKNDFHKLNDLVETLLLQCATNAPKDVAGSIYEGEPLDNFRDISVYPTTIELVEGTKPFLRKNVVKGPYRDVEHYLDVQFRLLREDFVWPLREGIQSYLGNSKARFQNVKIHKAVQFLQPITINEHFCSLLKFNMKNQRSPLKYVNSRRFMFGSLVCFTCDNFKSLIFGKIADRSEKYLKEGQLVIGFDEKEQILYNKDYVMVECNVYFEPYYHVLTVLKSLAEEDFPMINYIIDVDTTSSIPDYIKPHTFFHIPHEAEMISWNPLHGNRKEFFNFNISQNEAFVAALTRKLSIIQGPPGTGKTYVGLKIAKSLLLNWSEWYNRSPMLVICYTNHALDQFLEGLIDTTDEMVRIGGQSKNENLEKFNLRKKSPPMTHNFYKLKRNATNLLSNIKVISDKLTMIKKYDCIFDIKDFKEVIPQFGNSWLASAKEEDVLEWLIVINSNKQYDDFNLTAEKFKNLQVGETVDSENENGDSNDEDIMGEDIMEDLLSTDILPEIMSKPLFSLNEVREKIESNSKMLIKMEQQLDIGNYDVIFPYNDLRMHTDKLFLMYEQAKVKLDYARERRTIEPLNINVNDSKYIPKDERWNIYFHWLNMYYNFLLKRHETLNKNFHEAYKIYNETKDLENIKVLKNMKIIGMTTTGAARLHSSLQMIKSPIVIVEEAAEVLEAHIVTSLTKDCQQLILIGDHQQLKPSTSSYQIETFYNLGISLFERMILNEVQCFTLNRQHRMRPEISSLIKPAIYPNLEDDPSVFNRPKITGIENCLFFIDHNYPEEVISEDTTKKNMHEVQFLIQLARYLILNGYKPEEITILAAYLGQMYELQTERSKYSNLLKHIKITVLDNYQGEECDIILLSLVRNNSDNKIGFLSIDNRVCVALSRARNGLYIMGNIQQLSGNSKLWFQIKETLSQQGALGKYLNLKCQNHGKITSVSKADDFSSVVEGGCDQLCGMLLSCQHNCQRLCHVLDREHKDNKCLEPCNKILCDFNDSHVCQKKCYEECGPCTYFFNRTLRCNHEASIPCYVNIDDHNCLTEVHVTLPCGHEADKPCYVDINKHLCPFPCDTRLECGHSCAANCHALNDPDHLKYKCIKQCEKLRFGCNNPELEGHTCPDSCWMECKPCNIIVRKIRTNCSHRFEIECHKNVDEILCLKPCKKILPCGHKCIDKCSKPCGVCTKKVKKLIPGCNHSVTLPCNVPPDRKHCSGKCPRIMTCGHICGKRCNKDCDPLKCKQMVSVSISAKCGHIVDQVPCSTLSRYENEGLDAVRLEKYCKFPCKEILNCGPENKHLCSGTCGACFQGRIHTRCAEKCGNILICNHECEIPCRETCKPCTKPCLVRCKHSACKKKCGEPCIICKEKCPRRCKHQQCSKRCGDICRIPPCKKACEKILKACGHPCVGFCGDPCPPLCRICDKDFLEEIFFGTEDDEDARFVLLSDCGHVLESTGMESWLEQDKNEIKFKTCPKCKTPISTTQRYSDYIKLAVIDILKVKVKQYGKKEEIIEKQKDLQKVLSEFKLTLNKDPLLRNYLVMFMTYLDKLEERLSQTARGRAQSVSIIELSYIEIKYELLKEVHNILNKEKGKLEYIDEKSTKDIKYQMKLILSNCVRYTDDITKTEIEDIQRETLRLNRIVQLSLILGKRNRHNYYHEKSDIIKQVNEVSEFIFSLSKYESITDMKVKDYLTKLSKVLNPMLAISESEKRDIVKAMDLTKGHWFKCPNGHIYAIGGCGGAMEISNCVECGVQIGGRNHTLLSNNALASEMDGATHAAWSNAANMANYDLQDLR